MLKENEIFVSKDVCREKLYGFIKNCMENNIDIHTLSIYQSGEQRVRMAIQPYSCEYKAQLYSLSKSFSSTAIGFLVDDGIIKVEDRVVDIFPDKVPEVIDENLAKLKVKHLLSMNTGHELCPLHKIKDSEDIVKSFFAEKQDFEPGTHFTYNNAATYMLSEIVTKCTGMSMFDFLNIRLFKPLGMENMNWDAFSNGKQQGAVGLHAANDDLMKLGRLYLNKGVWEGKRILSEKWVEEATKFHSDNSTNGTPDWTAGYGYQFWMNAKEGYRGDGAFGQLMIVLPKRDMVIATQVFAGDMQLEMDIIFKLIDELYGESEMTKKEFEDKINEFNAPEKCSKIPPATCEGLYKCEDNLWGITLIALEEKGDCLDINFSNGRQWQTISVGREKYCESDIRISNFKPTLRGLAGTEKPERVRFASYYTVESGVVKVNIKYLNNPHTDSMKIEFENNTVIITAGNKDGLLHEGLSPLTANKIS